MIGLLLNQVQAIKSLSLGVSILKFTKIKKDRQDALLKAKEENKTKTEEGSQSLKGEHKQDLSRLSIKEEENILRIME